MPIIDLFQLYRQDAASFLGMLHHAAHHMEMIKGQGAVETTQTITFKYETLRILNEKMAAPGGPYEDSTIVAVGLLANAEVSRWFR